MLGRRIELVLPEILDKIVNQKRGGFCYELNSAFAWLLGKIGFSVNLLSARTYDGQSLGPEFDHMLIQVNIDQPVIADVGFGDSFLLPLIPGRPECFQFDRYYRMLNRENRWVMQERFEAGDWKSQYIFDMNSHPLHHFDAMCDYHQTSSSSPFTRKIVCSRATGEGRITFANGRYIENEQDHRDETMIGNEASLNKILRSKFGISFGTNDLRHLVATTPGYHTDSK
jgi:N-hydroxyarylamine O-acetyltransferase